MKKLFVILLAALLLVSCGAESAMQESEPASSASAASSVGESTTEESVPDTEEGDGTQSPDPDTEELRFENPQHAIYRDVKNELPDTEVMQSVAEKDAFFAAYLPDAGGDVYNEAFFETHTLVSVRMDPASSSWEEVTAVRIGPDGALTVEINIYSSYEVTLDMVPTSVLVSVPHKLSADCKIETESTFIYAEGYGSGFLHKPAEYPYAGVLDTYEEWTAFRKEYFPKWEDDGAYSQKLFDTRKVIVLAWMESYDSNRIEFAGLKPTENGAEASFVRHRFSGGAVLAVCGYRIFLLDVPKDYPVESGEELSMSITEGESYRVEGSVPGEEPTPEEEQRDPEKDWTVPEVAGFAFMYTGLGELYRDVLNSYEEWEAFRDECLQGEDCRYLYFPETFEHCKVIVLAWVENYHDTHVEYVSFVQNGDRAEATFRRELYAGGGVDACGTKLFLLTVPKDSPITKGEQVTITVKEENPYTNITEPVDILMWGWHEEEGCLPSEPSQVTLLTTLEEQKAFFATYGEYMELNDPYGADFFMDYCLLAVYSIQGSGSNSIEPVKLLLHPDGSLEVVMLLTTPGDFGWDGTDDVVEHLFFLPIPAYLLENGTPDVTVELLRLKNKIHVIYDLTAEELQSFVSATGEDSFPWDADTFRPGEDFLEPPVFHRWEDVICRFDCTPEGFAAELAEHGFTERIENITYFMDLGKMPVIWLQTEDGEYFITYSIGYGGEEFTFWRGEKFREHYAKRECKVTVDGKEIESAVPAVMYGGYADVPLLPILKAFGAEVTQPSPQEATAVIGDKTYYLDLVNMTFREEYEEEDWELGIPRAGGYGTIYPVDGDVMMEYSMLWDLLREEFGLNCTVKIDRQGLTVAFFSVK